MLAQLGRSLARWRVVTLTLWAAIAVAGSVYGGAVFDRAQSLDGLRPDLESSVAQSRLEQVAPEGELVVAVLAGRDFFSTDLIDSASRVLYEVREIPGVAEVSDAYTSGATTLIADDRRGSLVVVELEPNLNEEEALAVADDVAGALRAIDTPEVLMGGELLAKRLFAEQAIRDAVLGESVALVVLVAVLIIVLGGVAAAGIPLAAAVASIAGALLGLTGLAGVVAVSEYAVNVVTLLGLGLTVDYSLLILARFNEERAADRHAAVPDLLARTMSSAGRAVMVSGLAVGIALAGLFVFAEPLLAAMAMGGAVAVFLATLAGLTLVPALVVVVHRRLPMPGTRTWVWRHARRRRPGFLARLAAVSQRHAGWVAAAATAALLLLGAPLLSVNLSNSDARSLPAGSEERRVAEAIESDFTSAGVQPITAVVDIEPTDPAVQLLLAEVTTLPGVHDVDLRDDLSSEITIVDVEPTGPAAGAAAQRIVRDIRMIDAPVPVLVTGPAAQLLDAKQSTARRIPIALAVVIVPTAILLFALTGSVVVPVKAIFMNVLTLMASCGVLVAIFQWGWGAGILGFEASGALDLTTPLLLFMFIFGLSMDYEVFLLARIKEEWDGRATDDRAANDRAVLEGIIASGPVVTAAAVSIGIVFLGFSFGQLLAVKEIGVGMAVALLLDVTVMRGLLLPASMSLLGRWNWWRPSMPHFFVVR